MQILLQCIFIMKTAPSNYRSYGKSYGKRNPIWLNKNMQYYRKMPNKVVFRKKFVYYVVVHF